MSFAATDFHFLFESAPVLLLVLDRDLKIVAATDAYLRATMVKREAIVGRSIFDVFPDSEGSTSGATVRDSMLRTIATKKPDTLAVVKYDIPRPASEGGGFEERYWSPVHTPVLGNDGEVLYVIHRVEDVTEFVRLRKLDAQEKKDRDELRSRLDRVETDFLFRGRELEAAARALEHSNAALLAAKADADKANGAKSTFLASMSHEIRTPLNGVIANLELLGQTELTGDQEELLLDADKAAKSLMALIGNILDFSKIEAGKFTFESVPTDPAALMREAVTIVQSRARQNGLFVTASVTADVPQLIATDAGRLRQILLNLLGNAVKFTAEGGVHVRLTYRETLTNSVVLAFEVHDSGAGFDQAHAQQLFEPFIQDAAAAGREGTGLGLSISKRLVEALGGEIRCEAEPGRGASFFFTIKAKLLKGPPLDCKARLEGRKVLVVNADSSCPELDAYFVERGARVVHAAAAQAEHIARSEAAQDALDLAIFVEKDDSAMEPSFAGAIRAQRALTVVYTHDLSPRHWRDSLRSGAAYLMRRPIRAMVLDRNLEEIVGAPGQRRRSAMSETAGQVSASLDLKGRRLLVLEDRLVNQTVIQRQLRQLGISATVATNGVDGLERLAAGDFDLILCDCSMPKMDGYEFTRRVRNGAAGSTQAKIPIIAMTANAFREDMEKCFAAGMDDFISKPVTLDRLAAVIAKWLNAAPPDGRAGTADPPSDTPIDLGALATLLGTSDRSELAPLLATFRDEARSSLQQVLSAAEAGDAIRLRSAAHGAKGEARNAGAGELGLLYEELEHLAKGGDVTRATQIIPRLANALERTIDFIEDYRGG